MLRNSTTKYGSVTKVLHWLIFTIIVIQLILGFSFDFISRQSFSTIMFLHKSFGLLLFFVAVIFILWRCFNPKPNYTTPIKFWEKTLAYIIQCLLYLLLLAMPLSGWIMSTAAGYIPSFFGLFSIACPFVAKSKNLAGLMSTGHYYLAWTLICIAAIHIAGALKHQLVDKHNFLQRMSLRK